MNANMNANESLDEMVDAENGEQATAGTAGKPAANGNKRQPDVASEIATNADGKPYAVRMTFGGDATRQIEVSVHKLTEDILLMATLHGLKQKLGDAAAISRNPETGRSATAEDKYNAVLEVANRLLEGEWNKRRENGGQAGGLLLRALTRLYAGRMDEAQVKEWLAAKNDKEKAALRLNAKVAAEIERIRAEDGAGKGSADDLLAELEQLGTDKGA